MAKTGHPNFALKFKSPWKGNEHQWSVVSSHSGATLSAQADALAFLQGVAAVIGAFIAPASQTFISGYDYYNGQDSAALFQAEYATNAAAAAAGFPSNAGFGNAYGSGVTGFSGLETCVVLAAPVGLSKTGKPVAMRKFIHGVPAGNSADTPPYATPTAANFAKQLGDGSLPSSRVLITASGKQGSWIPEPYFGNHQMPRRRNKKSSGGLSITDALTLLKDAAQAGVSDA